MKRVYSETHTHMLTLSLLGRYAYFSSVFSQNASSNKTSNSFLNFVIIFIHLKVCTNILYISVFIYIQTSISQNLNLDKLLLHYEQNYKMGVNSCTGYIPWQVNTMEHLTEIQNITQDMQ